MAEPGLPTRGEIDALLLDKVAEVLALGRDRLSTDSRLDEDLHADSLDVVEIVEHAERALRARGVLVRLPEEELIGIRTVGDVAERLHARVRTKGPG